MAPNIRVVPQQVERLVVGDWMIIAMSHFIPQPISTTHQQFGAAVR
jgi:hypothetical protein